MKKILGIVAVALFVGAPVFGQTAPFIKYTLQLGGDDKASVWENEAGPALFDTTNATELDTTVLNQETQGSLLTWAVRVEAGGDEVDGVANAVWDLKLEKKVSDNPETWEVVGGDFGLGSHPAQGAGVVSVPGFLSLINDGLNDGANPQGDPLEAAAFTWAFMVDGAGPGRMFDTLANGGPHMERLQYPSTKGFPDGVRETPIRGVSGAPSGWLMGMGAGYQQMDGGLQVAMTERGGVGMPTGFECDLGTLPIAEGQINMDTLPAGFYRLALVPGRGNNVLLLNSGLGETCMYGSLGGNFAQAGTVEVDANGLGDTIVFEWKSTEPPPTPPTLASAKSLRNHTGVATPLGIEFYAATLTECRKNEAPLSIALKYSEAIGGTPVVTVNGAAVAATITGDSLTFASAAAVANNTCAVIVVNGIQNAAGTSAVAPEQTLKLKVRYADVTGDGRVNVGDTDVVRFASSPALVTEAKCHLDVDLSGRVNVGDTDQVRFKSSPQVTNCP